VYGLRIWYDHPTWWQWLILAGVGLLLVFVIWGTSGGSSGTSYDDPDDDGRSIY